MKSDLPGLLEAGTTNLGQSILLWYHTPLFKILSFAKLGLWMRASEKDQTDRGLGNGTYMMELYVNLY